MVLGIEWPLQKGWLEGLIGKEISEDTANKFLAARNPKKLKVGLQYPKSNQESPVELTRLICTKLKKIEAKFIYDAMASGNVPNYSAMPEALWTKFYQEIKFYLDNFMRGAVT